jgi:hypothetical protein
VSWSTLFRLDGTDEIDQAGGSLIFARSQGGLRDKDELGKSMKLSVFSYFGQEFDSPRLHQNPYPPEEALKLMLSLLPGVFREQS